MLDFLIGLGVFAVIGFLGLLIIGDGGDGIDGDDMGSFS